MRARLEYRVLGIAIAVAAGVVLLVCAGCETPTTVTTTSKEFTVHIRNLTFEPATLTVTPGTTVTWVNDDQTAHTSTSDATTGTLGWDSGVLNPGASFKHTFDKAGDFAYHCQIHGYLKGTVIVR